MYVAANVDTFHVQFQARNYEWRANLWIWLLLIVTGAVSLVWCIGYTPDIKYFDKNVGSNAFGWYVLYNLVGYSGDVTKTPCENVL